MRSRTIEQPSTFDVDPWGYSEAPEVVEKPGARTEVFHLLQNVPIFSDYLNPCFQSPAPLVSLPPPPTPVTRRLTTTQPASLTTASGELFPPLVNNSTTSVTNDPFSQLTPQQQQQEQLDFFDTMPVVPNTSSAAANTTNEFDLFTDFSSDPTSVNRTDDLFFS